MKRTCIFLCQLTTAVHGHGLLTKPSSKNGGSLATPLTDSTSHFALGSYGIIDKAFFDNDHSKTPWSKPGEFDFRMARDLIPGHPEVLHPCGCNAGDIQHCAGVDIANGFGETTLGEPVTPPVWHIGGTEETAWNAWVNHGGGYIYMLCKKSTFDSCRDTELPGNSAQATESQKEAYLSCVWECFESGTLEWVPGSQKLQFQDDSCTYAAMKSLGKPGKNNSIWRYTPIPDSLQVTNGGEGVCMWDSVTGFSNDKAEDEFKLSFGDENVCDAGVDAHSPHNWHVKDKIKVPMNLEEGEYLLSWRWDAYMADQMWTNCADVNIISSSSIFQTDLKEDLCTPMPTAQPVEPSPTPMPAPTTPQPLSCPSGYSGIKPYDSCTKYFHCKNGVVDGSPLDCPDNTLFDVDLKYCNYAHLVTCETESNEGCHSNNYKDCNHPDFDSDNYSCSTVWLPNGSRNSCVALWGKCDVQSNNCCEPAFCYGDNSYAQCVSSNTPQPSPACVVCDDIQDKGLKDKGKVCAAASNYLKKKCNKKKKWRKKKYCQLSCFKKGLGYDGDVCCNGAE